MQANLDDCLTLYGWIFVVVINFFSLLLTLLYLSGEMF